IFVLLIPSQKLIARTPATTQVEILHLQAALKLVDCLLKALLFEQQAAEVCLLVHVAVRYLVDQSFGIDKVLIAGIFDCSLQLDQLCSGELVKVVPFSSSAFPTFATRLGMAGKLFRVPISSFQCLL